MDAILPVYKPAGITSYDVIRRIKKQLPRGVKIGHAGTLDPFAQGVLLLLIGKATKRFDEIQKWQKTYRAVAVLGAKSDTMDRDGEIIRQTVISSIELGRVQVQQAADKFVGQIDQLIPNYSAAKVAGKPRYKYARNGEEIPRKSKRVVVYSIEVVRVDKNKVELLVRCGSGTYIRQLSFDIIKSLGIESYLVQLTREAVGKISISECVTIDELTDERRLKQHLLPAPGE